MKASLLDYPLPEAAVAQAPLRVRDACKLCVVERASGSLNHRRFLDLPQLLDPGDLLVFNNSRVARARIPCVKKGSGGAMEVFLLSPPGEPARRLRCFFKPGRRAKPGSVLLPALDPGAGAFEIVSQDSAEGDGGGEVEWLGPRPLDAAVLDRIGLAPLPPYIRRPRLPAAAQAGSDARYYQTVYAKDPGSAAAPTAGLHFSPRLISRLKRRGLVLAELTLHVGAGTFLPVKSEDLDQHAMHAETYELPKACLDAVLETRRAGKRVVAVGTTSLRALESAFGMPGGPKPGWASTRLLIQPGYRFKACDALITNFHQPKSTLLALVAAFYSLPGIREAYETCLLKKYRFLSFGDAMLLI